MTNKPQFVGEKQSLENRVEYVRGVTYKAAVDLHEELDENGYVLLRANNIQEGELRFDDVQYVDRTKVKPKQLLRRGDILFCASSGSKGLVGKAALVRESMPVTFGAFCCVLRPKGNEAEYLGHYFQSRQYRRAIEEVCSGSNINNLKAANFLSLIVPNYDGDSTRAISALFDLIDAQVKQAKDQIAQLDFLVKSRFVEMFGDPVANPKGWDVSTIKKTAITYGDGPFGSNLKSADYVPSGVRVIRLGNIMCGEFSEKDQSYVSYEKFESLRKYECIPGEVVIATLGNPILRACIVPDFGVPSIHKADWMYYETNKEMVLPVFAMCAINHLSMLQRALLDSHGQTRARINSTQAGNLPMILPPMDLQQEFAAFVSQVDKSRFIAQQQIEKLQMLYDSLAQEYFGD